MGGPVLGNQYSLLRLDASGAHRRHPLVDRGLELGGQCFGRRLLRRRQIDGELAQALLHPRYHVPKTYLIKVKGVLTDEQIRQLEHGVKLEDGMTSPAQVKKVRKVEANSWLEITIREGRKHQVKRMLESVGHPVIKLMRIRMGSLSLGNLESGDFRFVFFLL